MGRVSIKMLQTETKPRLCFTNTSSRNVIASKSFNPISSYSKREGIFFPLPSHGCRLASISSRIECAIFLRRTSMMANLSSPLSADRIAGLAGAASACGDFKNDILYLFTRMCGTEWVTTFTNNIPYSWLERFTHKKIYYGIKKLLTR